MSKNLFKLILIGSSNVGKTSIIKQLISQEFNDNFISTIGVHFYTKNLIIDEKK
jgi:GTPase SAR1 family protein